MPSDISSRVRNRQPSSDNEDTTPVQRRSECVQRPGISVGARAAFRGVDSSACCRIGYSVCRSAGLGAEPTIRELATGAGLDFVDEADVQCKGRLAHVATTGRGVFKLVSSQVDL